MFFAILDPFKPSHFCKYHLSHVSQAIHGPRPLTSGTEQQQNRSISTFMTSIGLSVANFCFGNGSIYFWVKHFTKCFHISFWTNSNSCFLSWRPWYLFVTNSSMLAIANKPQSWPSFCCCKNGKWILILHLPLPYIWANWIFSESFKQFSIFPPCIAVN